MTMPAFEPAFVFITASYNNAAWYEKNLGCVFAQTYPHWRMIYTDDCSTDGTAQLVAAYIAKHAQQERVTLMCNRHRRGHLANQYDAIHACDDHEIIIILDGDDWLAHENVLQALAVIYQDPDVWLTYGQFKHCKRNFIGYAAPVPADIMQARAQRSYHPWVYGHLRSFYASLFKRIAQEDLLYEGTFFPMAADVAVMLPMVEMASEHVRYVDEILYVYNDANALSFFHTREKQQQIFERLIRRKKPYAPLECLGL